MIRLSKEEIEELSKKKFCIFDEYAIHVLDLPESDPALNKFLSYNPVHSKKLFEELKIKKDESYFYNEERELIKTDRTGFRGYNRIYSQHFQNIRDKKLNILEIGIEYGYGLLAWSRYFENSQIYGMEKLGLDKFKKEYDFIKSNYPEYSKRIHFKNKADSTQIRLWNKLYKDKKFDIIIDDGGHTHIIQYETFRNGVKFLSESGMYFIEDIKLELDNAYSANKFFQALKKISSENGLKMSIYKHVSPYRIELLRMKQNERFYHLYNHLKKTHDAENENFIPKIQYKLDNDNGNYFNYMITFTR